MTNSYTGDDSHDSVTGAYIKPEDRVSPVASAQTATAPDPYTITEEEEPTVSVGTSANEYNPDFDPRIHPEITTGVGVSDTVGYNYTGEETFHVGIDTGANVVITEDINITTDPYAAAVDYSVAGMGTGSYDTTYNTPHVQDNSELQATLDRVLDQHIHLLHHQHETMKRLEEVNAKIDHLLEHMHQPMTGTLQIDCPQKVGAGYTV